MQSVEDTLRCNCASCNGGFDLEDIDPAPDRGTSNGANITLYNANRLIVMRGCFHNKKLMCGIWCVYDEEKRLEKVKIYREGILIGEAVMP